jgi:hypothetical protein
MDPPIVLPQVPVEKVPHLIRGLTGVNEDENFENPPPEKLEFKRTTHPAEHVHLQKIRAQNLKYQKLPPPSSTPTLSITPDTDKAPKVGVPVEYPGSPHQDFQVAFHAQMTPDYLQGNPKYYLPAVAQRSVDPVNLPRSSVLQSSRVKPWVGTPVFWGCSGVLGVLFFLAILGGLKALFY